MSVKHTIDHGVIVKSEDTITGAVGPIIAGTAKHPLVSKVKEQAGPDFGLFFSTDNELMVGLRTNVRRYETAETFNGDFWTQTNVGSGTSGHAAGELVIGTGITANSSAILESKDVNRQMAGTTQYAIIAGRLSDNGVANNKRRWGIFDANNGFFFELDGTTLYVVSRKAGIDTRTAHANWNGPAKDLFDPATLLAKMNQYNLFFGGMSMRWHVNGQVAHGFGAGVLDAPLTEKLSLPFRFESVNSGGQTADAKQLWRGVSFHRVSPAQVSPRHKRMSTATTTTIRSGPGTLRRVVVNKGLTSAGTVTLYDNTDASGDIIAILTIPVAMEPRAVIYELEFNKGLTVVTSLAFDLTIVVD